MGFTRNGQRLHKTMENHISLMGKLIILMEWQNSLFQWPCFMEKLTISMAMFNGLWNYTHLRTIALVYESQHLPEENHPVL